MRIYTGCSGYHYKDWKGKFYPEDMDSKNWLEFYAKQFNSVEINNTFYRIPEKKTLREWNKITPDDFRFAVKGSRYITHMKKLKEPKEHLENFYQDMAPLKDKTEVILWQLPGNLHKNEEKIDNFCSLLHQEFNNVIEFRHSSWFNNEIYEILARHNVIVCSLSAPDDLPEFLEDRTGSVYLRFHGKKQWYQHNYRRNELRKWSEKIKKSKADKYYIYFNNDQNAYSVENAREFMELVG